MTLRLRLALVGALAWSAAGCAPAGSTPSGTVLRADSAGIEIVTNLAPSNALPVDSILEDPVLLIRPDEEGDIVFDVVLGLAPLPDGGVAVGSHGPRTVYLFDDRGRLRRTVGGPGDGPGEFNGIAGTFVVPPDSLAVFDNWGGRLTLFTAAGRPARTVDVRHFMPPGSGARIYSMPGGFALVAISSFGRPRGRTEYRDSAGSYLLNPVGDSIGYYGRFPGASAMYSEGLFGTLPFGGLLSTAARENGHLVVGTGDRPELTEYTSTGRPVRIIRWPNHDRAVSSSRMEEFIEFRVSNLSENSRPRLEPAMRELPHADTEPAYYGVVVASDGSLWVGDYPGPEFFGPSPPVGSKTWTVLTADGERVRRIVGPPGFTVYALRDGLAYGVHIDEWGTESVVVYRVP